MVSSIRSLQSRKDFLRAQHQGEKALALGLVIQAVRQDTDACRVGFTASKKIGNAVCRNRARRRMRALARQHLVPLARPGIDYVLIARHNTINCDWKDFVIGLQKAVKYLHHKLPKQPLKSLP